MSLPDAISYQDRGERVWQQLDRDLNEQGAAVVPGLFTAAECAAIADLYSHERAFRKRIVMERHSYGRGEYKYFNYPLPSFIAHWRERLYPRLAPIANRWSAAMGIDTRYPEQLSTFLDRCHDAGQLRPTPLMLSYGPGDYNCLHQDLYGEHHFPLQAAILLSAPGADFTGGELVVTEQRPRMQSRPMVLPLSQGDAAVFPVQYRPVKGTRGYYRVNVRHGVSQVRSGRRLTLGLIFHDST